VGVARELLEALEPCVGEVDLASEPPLTPVPVVGAVLPTLGVAALPDVREGSHSQIHET